MEWECDADQLFSPDLPVPLSRLRITRSVFEVDVGSGWV